MAQWPTGRVARAGSVCRPPSWSAHTHPGVPCSQGDACESAAWCPEARHKRPTEGCTGALQTAATHVRADELPGGEMRPHGTLLSPTYLTPALRSPSPLLNEKRG